MIIESDGCILSKINQLIIIGRYIKKKIWKLNPNPFLDGSTGFIGQIPLKKNNLESFKITSIQNLYFLPTLKNKLFKENRPNPIEPVEKKIIQFN